MIDFRCWYCDRRYSLPETQRGEKLQCRACQANMRVPAESGGNSRHRTLADRMIEFAIYGSGGAVLGFLLAWVLISRVYWYGDLWPALAVIAVCTIVGMVAGGMLGEAGIVWLGKYIRRTEE